MEVFKIIQEIFTKIGTQIFKIDQEITKKIELKFGNPQKKGENRPWSHPRKSSFFYRLDVGEG